MTDEGNTDDYWRDWADQAGYSDGYWDAMAGRTAKGMGGLTIPYASGYARGHGEGQRRRNEANVR